MNRLLLALGVVAVVATAAYVLVQPGDGGAEGAVHSAPGALETAAPVAGTGVEAPPADPGRESVGSEDVAVASVETQDDAAAAERAAIDAELDTLTVALVDELGAPLADREVILLDRGQYDRTEFRRAEKALPGGGDPVPLLRSFGRSARTDSAGRVRFPWTSERSEVHVVCEWGVERRSLRTKDVVDGVAHVEVARPRLLVQVLDHEQRPLPDVEVLLVEVGLGETSEIGPNNGSWTHDLLSIATGVQGYASVDPIITVMAASGEFEGLAGMFVRAEALTADGPCIEVGPEHGPDRPVVVQLPPTGDVLIEVVEADGSPVDGETFAVQLTPADPDGPPDDPDAAFDAMRDPRYTLFPEDGIALFERVEVGLALDLVVAHETRAGLVPRTIGAVEATGETLRVRYELPARRALTLTVVDEQGAPLPEISVDVAFQEGSSEDSLVHFAHFWTDANGVGRIFVVDGIDLSAVDTLELSSRSEPRGGTLTLVDPIDAGSRDLGTATLALAPLWAGGRVIGVDGRPLSGANVMVMKSFDSDRDLTSTDRWWNQGTRTQTDAGGRFELRRFEVAEDERTLALALRAESDGASSLPMVELREGFDGHVLTMVPTGSLSARFTYSELTEDTWFGWRLVPDGEEPSSVPATFTSFDRMSWSGLVPGTYQLDLVTRSNSMVLVSLEGLDVPPGGHCEDPRLDPIELDEILRAILVVALDPDGEPVERWTLLRPGADGTWSSIQHDGVADVMLIGGRALEGWAVADGFAPTKVPGLIDDGEIVLQRGPVLRVQFEGAERRPHRLRFQPLGGPDAWPGLASGLVESLVCGTDLDEDLRGEVVLPGPGTYRVSAVIRIENSSGGYNTAYYGAGEVEVAEGQTELTIDAPPQLR